jgi:hypothetical protein
MQKPILPKVPDLGEIESRAGARGAIRRVHEFLKGYADNDEKFRNEVVSELTPLYGELAYTGGAPADGAQTIITVPVANTIAGYAADVTYDQDLQGVQMTWYSVTDAVKVMLQNNTGGAITLANGKFRAYVVPRSLSA